MSERQSLRKLFITFKAHLGPACLRRYGLDNQWPSKALLKTHFYRHFIFLFFYFIPFMTCLYLLICYSYFYCMYFFCLCLSFPSAFCSVVRLSEFHLDVVVLLSGLFVKLSVDAFGVTNFDKALCKLFLKVLYKWSYYYYY